MREPRESITNKCFLDRAGPSGGLFSEFCALNGRELVTDLSVLTGCETDRTSRDSRNRKGTEARLVRAEVLVL